MQFKNFAVLRVMQVILIKQVEFEALGKKNIVSWIKTQQCLIILQSVICTSTPSPYIVFHGMTMRL